jgi:hypothetical protein
MLDGINNGKQNHEKASQRYFYSGLAVRLPDLSSHRRD